MERYLVRTAVTGSFIESPFDLYGWLSFHDLPKNWKICILLSVDSNSTLTPAASEFSIVFMTKMFATVASLVNLVSDGKKVVSLYGAVFFFKYLHQEGRMKGFESTISFGPVEILELTVRNKLLHRFWESDLVRHFRLILLLVQVLQCFSVWPKCLGWALKLKFCWSRVKGSFF